MKFLTLSQKQIKNSAIYNSIKEKHVVISITSAEDEEITIPFNTHRVSQLYLKFDDVQENNVNNLNGGTIRKIYTYFSQD